MQEQTWIKCPICDGIGRYGTLGISVECDVCEGFKIINSITGYPKEKIQKGINRVFDSVVRGDSVVEVESDEKLKKENINLKAEIKSLKLEISLIKDRHSSYRKI